MQDYAFSGKPMFGKIGEWHFDKRTYAYDVLPKNMSYPPAGVENRYVSFLQSSLCVALVLSRLYTVVATD